ncbi:hypothetical protein ACFL1G_09375 [Planctomycetota bacterium]
MSAKFFSIIGTEISYTHTRIAKPEKVIPCGQHIPFCIGFYVGSTFNVPVHPRSQSNFHFAFHRFSKPQRFQTFSYEVSQAVKPTLNSNRNPGTGILCPDKIFDIDFRCLCLPFGNSTEANSRPIR